MLNLEPKSCTLLTTCRSYDGDCQRRLPGRLRFGVPEWKGRAGERSLVGGLFSGSFFFFLFCPPQSISVSERVLQLNRYIKACKPLKQVSWGKWLPLQSCFLNCKIWEIMCFFSATQDCGAAQMKSFPQKREVLSLLSLSPPYWRPAPRPMHQNPVMDRAILGQPYCT